MTASEWSVLLNHYIYKGSLPSADLPKLARELRSKLDIIELAPLVDSAIIRSRFDRSFPEVSAEGLRRKLESLRTAVLADDVDTMLDAAEMSLNRPTTPWRLSAPLGLRLRLRMPLWLRRLLD